MNQTKKQLFAVAAVASFVILAALASLSPNRAAPAVLRPKAASGAYFDYVVVIVMENQDISNIYGPLPYMTSLADNYSLAAHLSAIDHPSEPNYLALFGGLAGDCGNNGGATGGCMTGGGDSTSDCSPSSTCTMGANLNLVDRLEGAGLTWKAFSEDLGTPCDGTDPYPGFGTVRHFPFYYFTDITTSAARCAKTFHASEPTDNELVDSLGSTSTAANFMYLAPNDCNNMHSCSLDTGDSYLAALVPRILSSTVFQTQRAALLITFDEGSSTVYPTDYIYTVWAGPAANRAYSSTTEYTIYSILGTIEANWGLLPLQATDANAPVMSEFFTQAPPPTGPVPRFTVTPASPLVNTAATFNATSSSDSDPSAILQARWDWESDGTWDTAYSSVLTIQHAFATPGTYSVHLQILDSNSLTASTTHQVAVLSTADTTPPASTASLSGSTGSGGWYRSGVTLTLTATDGESGVSAIQVRVDGGSWQAYSSPIVVSGDGSHSVEYYATDNAGNNESVHTVPVRIDATPPATTASVDGTLAGDGSYVATANVTLVSTDDTSGVQGIQYRIDGGAWRPYTTTVLLGGNGTHSFDYEATDNAGNTEAARSLSIDISGATHSAPVTSVTESGSEGSNGWYKSAVTLTLTASGGISGAATIEYRVDGGNWTVYSAPLVLDEGRHVIEYQASDSTGYIEPAKSASVNVDYSPPTFGDTSPSGVVTTADVVVSWSATDDLSGIDRFEVSVDGAPFADEGGATTLSAHWADGDHVVTVRAIDLAGNSQETSITFSVQAGPFGSDFMRILPILIAPAIVLGFFVGAYLLVRRRKRADDPRSR